jgi:hypothetical protein
LSVEQTLLGLRLVGFTIGLVRKQVLVSGLRLNSRQSFCAAFKRVLGSYDSLRVFLEVVAWLEPRKLNFECLPERFLRS